MSRSPMSPHTMEPDNNSAQPHMKRGYRDPDQLCISSDCTCMLAMCLAIVSPRGSPHRRRIPDASSPWSVSALASPLIMWGRWLGACKYSVAGENQREWNVDNAMGKQPDSLLYRLGFYFMGVLLGWPSQSQVKQKLVLPRGHLARLIVKYYL